MLDLKNTKSLENMKKALFGESLARNKYTYYAAQARKEGHQEIADLFERMAKNEMSHAKIWFTFINGKVEDTETNLQEAAKGENDEWTGMYPEFARIAREEGLTEIAEMFEKVAQIEKEHERVFLKAIIDLKKKKQQSISHEEEEAYKVYAEPIQGYRCMFCGATFEQRPDVCPVCEAIGAFEECEIYPS